ncbi:MAG: phage integrase N-terminal SAM-like domain-containing protein [Oligoflexales bacterium]|nr:phage integrase N-terminal SAM-like domain-containing protein [Oligoflexales bacterium]
MTPLHQRVIENMKLRNFTKKTQKIYLQNIATYSRHFWKSPDQLGPDHIMSYLLYLGRCRLEATMKTACASLRFLYRGTLDKDWKILKDPFPKTPKKLSVVLSLSEVAMFPLKYIQTPESRWLSYR